MTPIKYSELARTWNIPYNKGFTPERITKAYGEWPLNIRQSGKLNERFIQLISQVSGLSTPTYFSGTVDNRDYHWVDGFPSEWLELGATADLVQVHELDGQFPDNVFDNEHVWCLGHTKFADYIVLGGSAAIAHELSSYPEIESFYRRSKERVKRPK